MAILNHEFSPTSQRLLYIRQDISRKLWQLLERDLRTGRERELYRTSEYGELAGVAASPDGKRLAMSSLLGRDLSVMPANGGTPRLVHRFNQGRYTNPEWAHDGKYLLIGRAKGPLQVVPVAGGQPQEINLQRTLWDRITMHPDGRQIAFASQLNTDSDADVWVMQNLLPETVAKQ